jgi:hypothetical protein
VAEIRQKNVVFSYKSTTTTTTPHLCFFEEEEEEEEDDEHTKRKTPFRVFSVLLFLLLVRSRVFFLKVLVHRCDEFEFEFIDVRSGKGRETRREYCCGGFFFG